LTLDSIAADESIKRPQFHGVVWAVVATLALIGFVGAFFLPVGVGGGQTQLSPDGTMEAIIYGPIAGDPGSEYRFDLVETTSRRVIASAQVTLDAAWGPIVVRDGPTLLRWAADNGSCDLVVEERTAVTLLVPPVVTQ
jgi:hypothetical protein